MLLPTRLCTSTENPGFDNHMMPTASYSSQDTTHPSMIKTLTHQLHTTLALELPTATFAAFPTETSVTHPQTSPSDCTQLGSFLHRHLRFAERAGIVLLKPSIDAVRVVVVTAGQRPHINVTGKLFVTNRTDIISCLPTRGPPAATAWFARGAATCAAAPAKVAADGCAQHGPTQTAKCAVLLHGMLGQGTAAGAVVLCKLFHNLSGITVGSYW